MKGVSGYVYMEFPVYIKGKDQLLEKLLKAGDAENMSIRRKCESELKSCEKRKDEVDRLFARLYEDYVTERITEYNF